MLSFPLLGRSRSWAAPCIVSLLSLLALPLLCASPAHAAHWVVTYQTNGTDTGSDMLYRAYTRSWPTASPTGGGSAPDGGNSRSETSQGTITPILTWTLDSGETTLSPAPDPAQAVVYVSINAQIDGNNGRGTSPCQTSASDSFGDTFPTTTSGTVQMTSGAFCHLATMGNSGGSTQVSLPAITLKAACSTTGSNSGGSTVINVVATPVNIVLGGVVVSGGQNNILIGQGCTGSWVPIQGGGRVYGTLSNWQWTVSGSGTSPGSRFQSWIVSSDQKTGKLTPGIGLTNQPTEHWYWDEAKATETVSCTATCSPPPNLGQPFTVTSAQKVLVAEPTYGCTQNQGVVYITDGGLTLKALPIDNISGHGETWHCNVQTPALFGSGGSCNFSQLITPSRSHTYSSGTVPCTENGKTGLDTVCPYSAESGDPYTVGTGTNFGWPADNSPHRDGDSPGTGLVDSKLGACAAVTVDEGFKTYLMYLPPGSDVQPVPLHEIDWKWAASSSKPAGGWSSENNTGLGPVSLITTARTYDHPQWSRIESPAVGSGW